MRLLLVEDDSLLADSLSQALELQGYSVDVAANGQLAEQLGRQEAYQLAILDLGLPDRNGLEVMQSWRRAQLAFPILVLTARDDWQDKVLALSQGADDYLCKPFHPQELFARLQVLIRRRHGQLQAGLRVGEIELDEQRQQVRQGQAEWQSLTGTEFKLLRYLMLHPGLVLSKEQLFEQIYNLDTHPDSNLIEVYIRRLRHKVGAERIRTQRGQGYVFQC
ncbi:response regulator transcription factor [Balneatrix alpica]|uniref:Response regulator transcription factor n=1 Tax=Balneatrix alpica TaxID=75684 RepID=A0ABV5ZB28_9GAMM|nr:response regulator transcription factor [Balneatrix alpica]